MCRQQTITQSKNRPLKRIQTVYAYPILAGDALRDRKDCVLWTWAGQDEERNFSIVDIHKGNFKLPEKRAPGGRVYSMTATGDVEKRLWIGTMVNHTKCMVRIIWSTSTSRNL